jgi:Mlc titration factor MtfA (ptsG expression regulator)
LSWYDDFVGVVVQPNEVIAHREVVDDDGVVHHYDEVITGEAMEAGPVMVSWDAVSQSGSTAAEGYNVVIHEFMHKIDMADGAADGCPPLAAAFMGARSATEARKLWLQTWESAYQAFREKVIIADRFGGEPTWLDPYGAERIEEFFAVACEGYFVNRTQFARDFADLVPLLEAFFGTSLPAGSGQGL